MNGTTPKQRAKNLKKELARIYDDGKGADLENVTDCLTDLFHLCAEYDVDFWVAFERAKEHRIAEWEANRINTDKAEKEGQAGANLHRKRKGNPS